MLIYVQILVLKFKILDHRLKFKLLNQGLVMKEQDFEHIQVHLKLKAFEDSHEGHVNIRSLWILSFSEGRSLLDFDTTICLLLTTCINKQMNSRTKRMKQVIPIEAKKIRMTTQRHYSNQVTFQRLGVSFSWTQSYALTRLACLSDFLLYKELNA